MTSPPCVTSLIQKLSRCALSTWSADRLAGPLLLTLGTACLVMLSRSDGLDPQTFPPGDSLYTAQNWLQATAILVSGWVLSILRVSKPVRSAAAGAAVASSGLLMGSAIVAVKHWRPYGGMGIGFGHTQEMRSISTALGIAAMASAVVAVWWLHRSRALPATASRLSRTVAFVAGGITVAVVAPLVGMGSSETMDVRRKRSSPSPDARSGVRFGRSGRTVGPFRHHVGPCHPSPRPVTATGDHPGDSEGDRWWDDRQKWNTCRKLGAVAA